MGPIQDSIDLTTLSSTDESEMVGVPSRTTPRKQTQPFSQPGSRNRKPGTPSAPPAHVPAEGASPLRSNRASAQKVKEETTSNALPLRTGVAGNFGHPAMSPPNQQSHQHASHRTPKAHTPKKAEWTIEKLEKQLRQFKKEIEDDGARLTARQIHLAWKKGAPSHPDIAKKNWFSELKSKPMEASKGTMKFKTKQLGPGRIGKQEKREHFQVICLKTAVGPVPNYNFHHVEIQKNILSPNTMLSFVPHLRDLADEEEPQYRRWLENLESMDKTSGFATLSRPEKVHKTMQKEHGTILLLYLDHWLDKLGLENCTKSTLIRYMASQTDAVTPQQKSSLLNSYNDDIGSPRTARAVSMFTEAFDKVFDAAKLDKRAVTLRDVLLLDKSVDTIVDTKKWMKDTPSQVKPVVEDTTVESFLETYALLGCLICCSHSCEHGEYGVDNERKRFSIEVVGGLEPLLRKKAIEATKKKNGGSPVARRAEKPCGQDCHVYGPRGTRAKPWSETETMLLKTFVVTLCDTSIPVQCATAVATGRPCWDVNRQFEKLDLKPSLESLPPPVKVKSVSWYDRHKKVLIGDWQDQTITHEHQRRDHFDPCAHEGPCDSRCPCVQHRVMCERFCRCTAETCAIKFTGCACHSHGKPCLPNAKSKDQKGCICVQLNRECDPVLCGSCGALERANPRNADNDHLYATGCQNVALQRGKAKSLILGNSMIENCGYGLFTAQDISQDDFVIEYVGELISQDEGVRREARRGDVFEEESNSSYLFTLLEQEGIWVDAAIYGNLSRYINHQDDADKRGLGCNITPKILYVCGEYRIKFSAMRDIKAGEELFFNYGENFPNLTKKLLDEQKEEEEGKEKVKKRKIKKEDVDKPKKPRGRPPKKRGPKPNNNKKAFGAAKVDSDLDDDDDNAMETQAEEDPFRDEKPRKRKRARVEDESEEEEYRPAVVSLDTSARGGNRKRFNTKATTSSKPKTDNLFTRAHLSKRPEASTEPETDDPPLRATPKRRGRKARKVVTDDHDDGEGHESAPGAGAGASTSVSASATRRSGGSQRSTRRHPVVGRPMMDGNVAHDTDSDEHEDNSPSRRRTRRAPRRNTLESSPLSVPAVEDNVELIGTRNAINNNNNQRSSVVNDSQDDLSVRGGGGRSIRGHVHGQTGNEDAGGGSQGADDSDGSNVNERTRVRRLPARYSD
ncbi:hypothetical protein PG996_005726 [Apiospora saccharicola]|uniref:SET domain-containing protein n=1 Tax=Apiospora saccharicola TaxID=335842 RepID=A0ABR1VRB4_9PEZI